MQPLSDKKIIESWRHNVKPWIDAVQQQQIENRKLVTDQAIINAVLSLNPHQVLDIGCGEGWLARALSSNGRQVTGLDVVTEFIDEANRLGGGDFRVMAYEDISPEQFQQKYDAAICNFSLIGKESVEHIFKVLPALLNAGGYLVIQTLNPGNCGTTEDEKDGWRTGSWAGFSDDFRDPAPWYFRTLDSWLELFDKNGFAVTDIQQPLNPQTGKPASLLVTGRIDVIDQQKKP